MLIAPRQDSEEHELLNHAVHDLTDSEDHEIRTAPIITRQAYIAQGGTNMFPQRGLLGTLLDFA